MCLRPELGESLKKATKPKKYEDINDFPTFRLVYR